MTSAAQLFPRPGAQVASSPLLSVACATSEERALAASVCHDTQIRGLGAVRHPEWAASRWRDVDPCAVASLPDCPCVTESDVLPMGGCFAGAAPEGWTSELHDAWCAQTGAGLALQPYCPGNPVPPVPDCLTAQEQQGVAYCNQYGFQGPNGILNALCWAAMSSGTLDDYNQRSACPPPAPPPGPPRTTTSSPPAQPPDAPPAEPPSEPEAEQGSFAVPGLILLLVAAGGAAYYFAQRK